MPNMLTHPEMISPVYVFRRPPICQDDIAGNVGSRRWQHVGSHDDRKEDLLSLEFHKHDGVGYHGPGHDLYEQGKG